MSVKPILFNTEMVRAILDGRKSCTRRIIKPQPDKKHIHLLGYVNGSTGRKNIGSFGFGANEHGGAIQYVKPPYQPGDILYVRETWFKGLKRYMYRADYTDAEKYYKNGKEVAIRWHPSIHMPKEAARIWLKVTDVRVERLQDITEDGCIAEGIYPSNCRGCNATFGCDVCPDEGYDEFDKFMEIWDSTIKKTDIDRYGWNANPWVWVIEFERCERGGIDG